MNPRRTLKNSYKTQKFSGCNILIFQSESGLVSRKDFEFVLKELGGIMNDKLIDEIFTEYDVDSDGFIDYDEFSFLVKNYLTDDDVA